MPFRRLTILLGAFACLTATAGRPAHADPSVNAIAIASGLVVLEALFADAPKHDEADFVSFEAGRFDPVKQIKQSNEFELEYRPGWFLWKFKPFVGGGVTTNESFFGYAGIRLDAYFGRRFIVTPSFAAVGYDRGRGKDLGSPVVARSGLDFQYRFDNDTRIGIGYHHMSHGKVFNSKKNPGTELVGITYSVPVKLLTSVITNR